MKLTADATEKLVEINEMTRYVLYGGASVFAVLFVLFFLSKKGGFKNKFLGLLAMLFGLGMFFLCFKAGLYVGDLTGIGEFGALGGVAVFAFLFSVFAYFRTPKDMRRKSKYF